ncbi:hypothetical protein [Marinilactibacillus kalidii]|uniref:hypothetical protein n=1 Tax=Marinilactibacillus kalidii TaxID=2820274 RepID=UPI001ABE1D16|nr:hypothetical protein [Marinilactibacillus kalidii]
MKNFQDREPADKSYLKGKGALYFGIFALIILSTVILVLSFFAFLVLSFTNY